MLSIVLIYTAGAVVRDIFVATEEQKDGRAVTFEATMPFGVLSQQRTRQVIAVLERRVVAQGGAYALVSSVAGRVGHPELIGSAGLPDATITLIAGRLDGVRRLPVLRGRWLSADKAIYPAQLLVNQAGAGLYGGLGTSLEIQPTLHQPPYEARIVGVIADGDTTPNVYASLTTALAFRPVVFSSGDAPDLFIHHPTAPDSAIHGLIDNIETDLSVDPTQVEPHRYDRVAQLLANLRATQRAFLGVAVIALAVAVIGMLNIGLASVRERSRELVIRRAVGATRARVFGLVLLSAVTIGVLSGLVAVAIALASVLLVIPHLLDPARALNDPAFPWSAAIAGLAAAIGAAVLGGAVPAFTASRIDVAYALRD